MAEVRVVALSIRGYPSQKESPTSQWRSLKTQSPQWRSSFENSQPKWNSLTCKLLRSLLEEDFNFVGAEDSFAWWQWWFRRWIHTSLHSNDGKYRPYKLFGYPNLVEFSEKITQHKRPEKPIEIYEYEACPFCRKVREAATILDLDVMFYPTPRNAPHHRDRVQQLGGKQSYPFMVDPNTSTSMYESDDIIAYLFKNYGDGNVSLALKLGFLTAITCSLCSVLSSFRGFNYRKAKYPEKPLIFWGFELSPFSVNVREVLTEMELPFLQINCGRGSPKRQQMKDKLGVFQAPYLEDPNTGAAMFESDKIIQYLNETYAL